jgi:hypothetical protein
MNFLLDFKASLKGRSAATIRAYIAGARKAIVSAGEPACATPSELAARIRARSRPARGRVAPFLKFLENVQDDGAEAIKESQRTREWVTGAIQKSLRLRANPSITERRDLALVAALCTRPGKGDPRNWPRKSLEVDQTGTMLWGRTVEEPVFSLALRLWFSWRNRLSRPDQRRLYRRGPQWSDSGLLFPGPEGRPLSRVALHNALNRLPGATGEGSRLTPHKLRAAFLGVEAVSRGFDAAPPI